jgi:hypothetical protein
MLFFESVSSPSFELTSDGSVVEQEADPED